jgi:hypothetical protein
VALQWMMSRMQGVGVHLATPLTCVPDCVCSKHDIHKPWDRVPFNRLKKKPRQPMADDIFHSSVVERWRNDAAYRPKALSFLTEQNLVGLKLCV